jgi:hypothetical protein
VIIGGGSYVSLAEGGGLGNGGAGSGK